MKNLIRIKIVDKEQKRKLDKIVKRIKEKHSLVEVVKKKKEFFIKCKKC